MTTNLRFHCFILICFFLLSHLSLNAQGKQCLAQEYYNNALLQNPELTDKRRALQQKIDKTMLAQRGAKNRTVITLPIVFHVIYNTSAQNIDSIQIASQIDVLNDDFRKMNDNFNIVQGGFVNIAADVELEFQLATTDPDGNPSNGITRKVTTNPAIGGSDFDYYDPTKGGVPAWDPQRYINVWVVNINSAGGDFGFATYPGEASPASSDGCVIDYKYFGTSGTAAASQPQHLGRTLTHEIGHYFGLFHIWGDVDNCNGDDNIADTPNQETSTETCPTYPLYDNCTSSGDGINFYNYMDYTDDACMAMFTEGQKAKMLAVLAISYQDGGRSELTQLFSSSRSLPQRKLELFPNPFRISLSLSIDASVKVGDVLLVYDMIGNLVYTDRVRSETMTIDLNNQPVGVYLVQIRSEEAIWTAKAILIK